MRRVVFLLALIVPLLLAIPVAPARAHESSAGIACSNEVQVAFHVTAAGNLYEATSVTCVGKYAEGGNFWEVEGIARIRCYRNAQPWDGCRGNGNIELQRRQEGSSTWNVVHSNAYAVPAGVGWPCSGEACWFSVSERFESAHGVDTSIDVVRGKNEGTSIRFLLADGTTETKSASDQWSDACQCYN